MTVHSTFTFVEILMWFAILGTLCIYCGKKWFVDILNHSTVLRCTHAHITLFRKEQYFVSIVHTLNCLKSITVFHVVNHRISPRGEKKMCDK